MRPSTNSRIIRATRTLKVYATKSSLHGLYHIYQSKELCRRIFWMLVLLMAFSGVIFHVVMSVIRYLDKSVYVHIGNEAQRAQFPEITLCNLKPFGESMLKQYSPIVQQYFNNKWGYFDNWFVHKRLRQPGERNTKYRERIKKLFSRFMELEWISENSRELGTTAKLSILSCSYEGRNCDDRSFTIVRDPEGWNCWNFVPNHSIPVGNEGLNLVLFTDSNFIHPIYDGAPITLNDSVKMVDLSTYAGDQGALNSMKKLLETNQRSLNQIAAQTTYQSDGVRLIIHEPRSHPMLSLHRLEFESGVAGIVTIDQTMVTRQNNRGIFECTVRPHKQVSYVTDFDGEDSVTYRSFDKLLDDYIVDEKQKIVHSLCGCYSHRYPLRVSTSALCYHVPKSERLSPTQTLMDRMDCHDAAIQAADKETYNLAKKFSSTASCDSMLLTFIPNAFGWPKNQVIMDAVNRHVLRTFANVNGVSSAPKVGSLLGGHLISRQEAILREVFNHSGCGSVPSRPPYKWCILQNEQMRKNVLKLTIKHRRRYSSIANENFSFEWPEALSEIGGICGLWLGMSVLTMFELMEILYHMALSCATVMQATPADPDFEDSATPTGRPEENLQDAEASVSDDSADDPTVTQQVRIRPSAFDLADIPLK